MRFDVTSFRDRAAPLRGVGRVFVTTVALAGCVGDIGDVGGDVANQAGVEGEAPTTAIPRLSRREIDATIAEVFGIVGAADKNLPADPKSAVSPVTKAEEEVYDTLSGTKSPSQVFVEGLEVMAFEVARDFSADPVAVDTLAGCTPVASRDDECLAEFVRSAGLRLWRRPMSDAEVAALVAEMGPLADDPAAGPTGHYVAVRGAISALIQSPELVYRSEIGASVGDGVVKLDNYELVARLSYFLWGTAPTPELLARAEGATFGDAALTTMVDEMLADPRAERQMRAFHELWLRYPSLLVTDAGLATDMRAETDALVDRAIAGDGTSGNWTELFSASESFMTPALASHYGLPPPAQAGWVAYDASRAGVLSHGSFLSLSETKLTETLPSRRGAMIGRRVLCEVILPPPPNVAIDKGVEVPAGSCKSDAYAAHATGTCKGCHAVIDGIGFGFERYDGLGRYREVEEENPSCSIEGKGTALGQPFSGPGELVSANMDTITACAVQNLARFATRNWAPSEERVARLSEAFTASDYDFRELMRSVALDPAFRHRVDAAGGL